MRKKIANKTNNSKISNFSPEVLKAIVGIIKKNFTGQEIEEVSESLKFTNGVFSIEKLLQMTDIKIISIIEKFMHPLSHMGDIEKTKAFVKQVENILWYDNLIIENDENRGYVIIDKDFRDIFNELKLERIIEKNPYREEDVIPTKEERMVILERKKLEELRLNKNNQINISYNINIGRFVFNGKEIVNVMGKQKNVSDCLVEAGENIKVSWDAINEKITGNINEIFNDYEKLSIKKMVHGAVTQINKKTEKYLKLEKPLIYFNENEYCFQYPIDKNG